jgi:bleomycin hydrolase
MCIVGMARDENRHAYYILKNSWGTDQPHEGLVYMPVRQLWHDVAAIYLTHDAWEGK